MTIPVINSYASDLPKLRQRFKARYEIERQINTTTTSTVDITTDSIDP
jgi:hypothetical protein